MGEWGIYPQLETRRRGELVTMKSGSDLLFAFKEHLNVLGRSRATVEAYSEHVKEYLQTSGNVQAATRRALEAYIAGLYAYRTKIGKPYQPGTIALKVRSLKRFFEFLEKANVILINPAELIREPQPAGRLPRSVLTSKELAIILDQPNLGTLAGIRDRTILEVFYSTGIRLEELCRLTIYDADLQGGLLRINQGKGKKDRVVPLGRHAVKFLREYVTRVRAHLTRKNRTERRLFINRYGIPISDQVVSLMIRTYARAAGLKKQVSAHTFRHTFATDLVKGGADIIAVQKMLGHSELKTTQVYLRNAGVDVKAAHKKSHPREREREETGTMKPVIERIRPERERRSAQSERSH
jgi:integrase/recombinase XerD